MLLGRAGSSGQVRRGCALLVLERLIHVVTEPLFLRPVTTSLLAGVAAARGSPRQHASPPFREPAARQVSIPQSCGRPAHCSATKSTHHCGYHDNHYTAAHPHPRAPRLR